jgi:hypothetical protein
MSSPAGRLGNEASEACEQKTDEVFNHMQVSNFEPQELMQFLEFCESKIHGERSFRKGIPASKRIQ